MSKKKRAKKGEVAIEETPVEQVVAVEEITAEEVPVMEEITVDDLLPEPEEVAPAEEEAVPEEEAPLAETEEAVESSQSLKMIVEAILFASQKPVSAKELIAVFKGAADADKEKPNSPALAFAKTKEPAILAVIEELEKDCADSSRAYEVRETAAGWQLVTKPDFSPWLRQLYPENRPARLSAPAMETLAIIAYRQPITRADIEAVRGVAVDGVMQTLLDRGLVKIAGRAEIPGRPLLYDTTQNFMEHFGLKDLDDLPNASELRKIELPKAEIPVETPPAETPEAAVPQSEPVIADEPPAEHHPADFMDEAATEEAPLEEPPAPAEEPQTTENEH